MKRYLVAAIAAVALCAPLAQAGGHGHGGRDRDYGRGHARGRSHCEPRYVQRCPPPRDRYERRVVIERPRISIRAPRFSIVIGGCR